MKHLYSNRPLSIDQRMELFRCLVEVQDRGMATNEARTAIAIRFKVDEDHVLRIEEEGIAGDWPLP